MTPSGPSNPSEARIPVPEPTASNAARWDTALLAAQTLAADPLGSGIVLRARPGPVRDRFLAVLATHLGDRHRLHPFPATISAEDLTSGLDLAASLAQGRPIARPGALEAARSQVILLRGADRIGRAEAAIIADAIDTGTASQFGSGLVALDESEPGEALSQTLADRLPIGLDLDGLSLSDIHADRASPPSAIDGASDPEPDWPTTLIALADAFGIASPRAPLHAARLAGTIARTRGHARITRQDLTDAVRLAYAHRATRTPALAEPDAGPDAPQPDPAPQPEQHAHEPAPSQPEPAGSDRADPADPRKDPVQAILADLPPGILAAAIERARQPPSARGGRGDARPGHRRGRPIGTRPGKPSAGMRIDFAATLRAACPWQTIRRAQRPDPLAGQILRISDLRIRRFEERRRRVTIFVVDASGSAAAQRLAEAKGAVEMLLAECYRRRDQVALIAFAGRRADLVLPPTGALARARNRLSGIPGGGGTPLCLGLDAAAALAQQIARRGETAFLVLLTDGRANVDRTGQGGRAQAETDALASAARLGAQGLASITIDISPRPNPAAARLADAMAGRYLALPLANAARLDAAIRDVAR